MSSPEPSASSAAPSTTAPAAPAVEANPSRPATILVLRGRTASGRGRDPLIVADVQIPDGVSFAVVLFSDNLVRLPLALPLVARIPDGRGGAQLVPVSVRTDRSSDLGTKVDIVITGRAGTSVVRLLPEVVRDPRGRRWLRPQRG